VDPTGYAAEYSGPSVVDFINSSGGDSSFASRKKLAAASGIDNYRGTAEQNTKLLGLLRGQEQAPEPKAKVVSTPATTSSRSSSTASSGSSSSSTNHSVVDYMTAQGADSSFANRKALAQQVGISNYSGTAEQNLELLSALSGNPKPALSTSSTVKAGQQSAKENPSYYVNGSSSSQSRSSSTTTTIYGIDVDTYNSMPDFAKEAARTYYNETYYPSYSGGSSSSYNAPVSSTQTSTEPTKEKEGYFEFIGNTFADAWDYATTDLLGDMKETTQTIVTNEVEAFKEKHSSLESAASYWSMGYTDPFVAAYHAEPFSEEYFISEAEALLNVGTAGLGGALLKTTTQTTVNASKPIIQKSADWVETAAKNVLGGKGMGNGGVLDNANFAQKTYNANKFSDEGIKYYSSVAGRPIKNVDDLVGALKNGELKPSQVPIDYVVKDGNTLILNTRSSQALTQAGIPRNQWNAVNRTGNDMYEQMLTDQLTRNKLDFSGTPTVRPSGQK
jgi:hypothetical protein